MIQRYLGNHDHPLNSDDLSICQQAFDAARAGLEIEDGAPEAERLGATIIALYRQGVDDVDQLIALVGAAAFARKP